MQIQQKYQKLVMDAASYHAHPALGSSRIKAWSTSIGHGLTESSISADAALFGTAVHAVVLENRGLDIQPVWDLRTKAGKETREEYLAKLEPGAISVSQELADTVHKIHEAIFAYEPAADLLDSGIPELSVFGSLSGVDVKGRADWFRDGILVDLKTVQNASYTNFSRDILSYKYHAQAWLYSYLFGAKDFYWICVEKKSPHIVSVFKASSDLLDAGERVVQLGLNNYRGYQHNPFANQNYYQSAIDMKLPKWAEET